MCLSNNSEICDTLSYPISISSSPFQRWPWKPTASQSFKTPKPAPRTTGRQMGRKGLEFSKSPIPRELSLLARAGRSLETSSVKPCLHLTLRVPSANSLLSRTLVRNNQWQLSITSQLPKQQKELEQTTSWSKTLKGKVRDQVPQESLKYS